jgi:hypothetical protein
MKSENSGPEMARPLGVRGHQKRSYLVASYKAKGEMFVESGDEHTTMLALDIDPRVLDIVPQPFTVRLDLQKVFATRSEAVKAEPRVPIKVVSGKPIEERVYTPDFLVQRTTPTQLLVESKSSIEIAKIAAALERRRLVLNNLGYHYLVVSSTEVEPKGLHTNLVHMRDAMRYRSKNETQSILAGLTELVVNRGAPFAYGEIRSRTTDLALYLALVSGVVGCDLRGGNLGVNTMIWPAHGDLAHLQLLSLEASNDTNN